MALGPTEERGSALWVGYEIPDHDDDLSHLGLIRVSAEDAEMLRDRNVHRFTFVGADDTELRRKLGLG
jgi:hypothetical protein